MNQGSIKFSKVGSDEQIAEFPFSAALSRLAAMKLTSAGNLDALKKENNWVTGTYIAYLAATMAHVDGLPKIKPEDVSRETMLEFSCLFDFDFDVPMLEQQASAEQDEVDENPTVTRPASS